MTAPARVRQADVQRMVKGAITAGMRIGSVRISPDGSVLLYAPGEDPAAPSNRGAPNPLDDLLLTPPKG